MEVRDDDLMLINFRVQYPCWMDEISVEEFNDVLKSARRKAIDAFQKELDRAEEFWRARKMAKLEGQMDIYDYA